MPRIDPKQLLKTLGVLLSNNGGIKSKDEVARLAQLMQKFSKKLVSKCIYVHILKATESSLLEEFLSENGWDLINQWFGDALKNRNLALALEILRLFLVCPMTKELLKANPEANTSPRLINKLRKDASLTNEEMRDLADRVYRKWVLILSPDSEGNACALRDLGGQRSSNKIRINNVRKVLTLVEDDSAENQKPLPKIIIKVPPPRPNAEDEKGFTASLIEEETRSKNKTADEPVEDDKTSWCGEESKLKEDGDQMSGGSLSLLQSLAEEVSDNLKKEDSEEKVNNDESSSKAHDEVIDKTLVEVKKDEGRKKSLSPPPSAKDAAPKKVKRDRPHHPRDEVNDDQKLHIKAMAKKLKEEAQAKKDKETLKVISGEKMGRIPKIPKKVVAPPTTESSSSEKKEAPKKAAGGTKSFSDLLVGLDSKPKTVKTPLNRNKTAALLEGLSKPSSKTSKSSSVNEVSKAAKIKEKKDFKQPAFGALPASPLVKKDSFTALPKKEALKPNNGESKGGKSGEAKSKKDVHNFSESSSFMDAIFSSMGPSDVPRKKKRRLSDKDESSSPKQAKPADATSEKKKPEESKESSPAVVEPETPAFSFYRDTLDDEPPPEKKEVSEPSEVPADKEGSPEQPAPTSDQEPATAEDDLPFEEPSVPLPREVKGILVYHRGKEKRNKAISWKPETELTAVRFFELDETERVNVNKLKYDFTNMRKREFDQEKAAMQSKGSLEEESNNKWYKPFPITVDNRSPFKPGESSKEKGLQALREAEVLQAIYFSKESVPDTPGEPDVIGEIIERVPVRIPLDDKEGIPEESEKDFSQGGWPVPKVNDVDRESGGDNGFSLPPSLSNFLSSINPSPPLSQEEQSTLAAQAQAMQKMGMIRHHEGNPPAFPPVTHPPPTNVPPPVRPPPEHFFAPPPAFSGPPPPMMNNNNNDFHPGNNNNNFNRHPHPHPPPHRGMHPYRGFHGHRPGGPGRFNNDRQNNGFRPKEHHDNRDFRDRSRDPQQQQQQHMMGGGRRVCKFYSQRGHCRDGERCRFLHDNR